MDKWHQFLYGTHDITVHTDHQPRKTIFKKPPQQSTSPTAANDHSWYKNIGFQFGKRNEGNFTLPTLSPQHLPLIALLEASFKLEYEIAENDIEPNRVTSKTMEQIKQETAKDSVLASLCDVVTSGWPAERKETQSIKTLLEFQR